MVSLKDNLKRLKHLVSLSNRGWNGYESEPIGHGAVQNTESMLKKVIVQPKIFPLANGNIQLEYYNREKGMDYLELEVSEIGIKDSLSEEYMDIYALNMWLKDFYGIA